MTRCDRYTALRVNEVPEWPAGFNPGIVYVIGDDPDHVYQVAFLCPCGCDLPYIIPVRSGIKNRKGGAWGFDLDAENLPSLDPSVSRKNYCQSHFYLRHGAIEWC